MSKLTAKELRLIEGVVAHGNKSRAAREAGYSKKSAPQIADETLKKPHVAEALEKKRKEFIPKGLTPEFVLNRIEDLCSREDIKPSDTIAALALAVKVLKLDQQDQKIVIQTAPQERLEMIKALISKVDLPVKS